jgi:hypothetical protein
MSRGRSGKLTTFGELTSDKLSDFQIQELSAFSMVPGDGTEVLQRCGGYTYDCVAELSILSL